MRNTIITCALTGGTPLPKLHHNVPKSPKEIADQGLAAAAAGAAILHIHVREPVTGEPSTSVDYFEDVVRRIRAENREVLLSLTMGFGAVFIPTEGNPRLAAPGTDVMNAEDRMRHVLKLKPEICTLDLNTMQTPDIVIMNTEKIIKKMAVAVREAGVRPEVEIFEAGDLVLAQHLLEAGFVDRPAMFSLALGLRYGLPATTDAMLYGRNNLPSDAIWTGFGISASQMPMVAQSYVLGGHARVGLEDNLYLERGVLAPHNAALVERARSILELMGATIATPRDARQILGLPH